MRVLGTIEVRERESTIAQRKRTNNDLQNTTQKTED
jgi:hypothetical protein